MSRSTRRTARGRRSARSTTARLRREDAPAGETTCGSPIVTGRLDGLGSNRTGEQEGSRNDDRPRRHLGGNQEVVGAPEVARRRWPERSGRKKSYAPRWVHTRQELPPILRHSNRQKCPDTGTVTGVPAPWVSRGTPADHAWLNAAISATRAARAGELRGNRAGIVMFPEWTITASRPGPTRILVGLEDGTCPRRSFRSSVLSRCRSGFPGGSDEQPWCGPRICKWVPVGVAGGQRGRRLAGRVGGLQHRCRTGVAVVAPGVPGHGGRRQGVVDDHRRHRGDGHRVGPGPDGGGAATVLDAVLAPAVAEVPAGPGQPDRAERIR